MFRHWLRVDKQTFSYILDSIRDQPEMAQRDSRFRKCVPRELRLARSACTSCMVTRCKDYPGILLYDLYSISEWCMQNNGPNDK